ncbi:MAG: transglycosylase domain-containing protein [Alphaproteobacteria bacterium]|nr:transglycosylase domain-containing protein [Alphaproteobacteria bacterium]
MRIPRASAFALLAIVLLCVATVGRQIQTELHTSEVQSQVFSNMANEIRFEMQKGPNPDLYIPTIGPYNQRLGYSYIPFFAKALEAESYTISEQMRASSRYQQLVDFGLYPVYRAKTATGFSLYDRSRSSLYSASYPSRVFSDFRSIPDLLVDTLLFIENRELLKPGPVTRNPVIEWDRFFYAAIGQLVQGIAPGFNAGGGSTLATQIEKFRYSPGGQTSGVKDKLRQIVSASIQAYLNGPDTRSMREHIVLDYLNSTPLSARQGFGEVNSIGDGLWAWFGRDLTEATAALNLPESDIDSLRTKATIYREALGLILAQRRPTYYLLTNRDALDELTDSMLDKLARENVISSQLRDATKVARLKFLPDPPPIVQPPYLDQKAANALRNHLLMMLGIKNLYELDRIDLTADSTMDQAAQQKVADFLKKMGDREFIKSIGLYGFRLLNPDNDPAKIKWSVVLYERGEKGNRLRIQADNIDGPFDMNEGVKLDLGSTAKLRTLVTYLEIIGELHRRYAGLSAEDLQDITEEAPDALTSWATSWLTDNPDATLPEMLEAAMDRKYSASPHEVFFTGGGAHTFGNFEKEEDSRIMDVREALRHSVNLVFIRIMRDIVNYSISQGAQTKQELIGDPDNPARKEYLERFADREGSTFLNRYINDYEGLSPDEVMERISSRAHKGATSRTILFSSIKPQASYAEYVAYMRDNMKTELDDARLRKLFKEYPASRYSLSDRGYISGINPLELWLVAYLQANPKASRSAILAVSKPIRIDSYAWLLRPSKKGAQDTRIRILLEMDAFARIQKRWARLGYPFEKLVPSYATAIGSSADRPGALAELAGILLNNGVRQPMIRFEKLHFAANTPYETILKPNGKDGEQVLDPAIAKVVRAGMMDVVENGTARRLSGAYIDIAGKPLAVGGKTGTGDHRFDEFGAGGRLISSRVVNRTGSLVFFIGDKWFGTITAHVAGEEAAKYKFTSALSAQMLKSLSPILTPLINGAVSANLLNTSSNKK